MLWDAAYVPQANLSETAARSKLGTVIDVRRVSGKRAAHYVAKYLAKDGMQHPAFRHARRYAIRAAQAEPERGDWRFTMRCPALVAVDELGCTEIDWEADGWCSLNKGAG
jgi:hypothetical protein